MRASAKGSTKRASTKLTPLPRLSQDCISAFIVQVGATGAAEHQAELSLADRVWYQGVSATGRMLTATLSPKAEIRINRSLILGSTA